MQNKTKQTYLKTLLITILLATLAIFSLNKIDLIQNTDLGRFLTNGKLIFEYPQLLYKNFYSQSFSNMPFINHHWLFGVIIFQIQKLFGFIGLHIFKIMLLIATLLTLIKTSKNNKTSFYLNIAISCSIVAAFVIRNQIRPELFSYLFFSIFLLILFSNLKKTSKTLYFLPLVQVFWVNTHIYFFLGPTTFLFFLIHYSYQNKLNFKKNKILIITIILIILACLLNPNTIKGMFYPLLIFKDIHIQMTEMRAFYTYLNTGSPFFIYLLYFIFIFISTTLLSLKKQHIFNKLLGLLGLLLLFTAARNIGFSVIIFYLITCINITNLKISTRKTVLITTIIPIIIFIYFNNYYLSNSNFGLGLNKTHSKTTEYIKKHNLKGPIFNSFGTGSYITYCLSPNIKPFIDSRPEAFNKKVWQTYNLCLTNPNFFKTATTKYNFKLILIPTKSTNISFIQDKINDPNWLCVTINKDLILFALKKEHPKLANSNINSKNIASKISYLWESNEPQNMATWIYIMYLFNHETAILNKIESHLTSNKENKILLLTLGNHYYIKGNYQKSLYYYQKALQYEHPKTELFKRLSSTHKKLGNNIKSKYYFIRYLIL